jgi:hypothetical protein
VGKNIQKNIREKIGRLKKAMEKRLNTQKKQPLPQLIPIPVRNKHI